MSNTKTVMGQASNQYVVPTDITDVFSTYLYTGNGSTQTITNGIDLAGEGGIVWTKSRSDTGDHNLFFENGSNIDLVKPNKTDSASLNMGQYGVSFNSNGFSMAGLFAPDTVDIASWTFRKAPKFFDVVSGLTSDGSGNLPEFNHSLDTTPGCVFLKATDSGSNWIVFHRGLLATGANQYIQLNSTNAATNATGFGVATPTTFEVGAGSALVPNVTYVAYLFAHNDGDGGFGPDGSDIIKCGSYTGNGSTDGPEIDLGFEPQWLMYKNTNGTDNWEIVDVMRGMPVSGNTMRILKANTSGAESSDNAVGPNATGFKVTNPGGSNNDNGSTYIYIAIRRGPLAPPTAGTEVFDVDFQDAADPSFETNFTVDAGLRLYRPGGTPYLASRLTGNKRLATSSTSSESSSGSYEWDFSKGWGSFGITTTDVVSASWKRAPGFFDVVAYTGTGSQHSISHNLGVAPEMMWVKTRSRSGDPWFATFFNSSGTVDYQMRLNQSTASPTGSPDGLVSASSSTFTVPSVSSNEPNVSNATYIAYLFASLPGISKVGSYTGNGTSQTIDCGFTSGARFVLIKNTDAADSWILFDSARGIVAGNDPYLFLNHTYAEGSSLDLIDPYSAGFEIVSGDATMNTSGQEYIFYAIA